MWETWCHTVSQPRWLWGNLPVQAWAWVVSALEDFFFFCQFFSSLFLVLIQFHVVFRVLTISGYSFVLRTRQGGAYWKHPIHNRRTNNQRVRNFLIQKQKNPICCGQGCFGYSETALFNTFCFWGSEPRNSILKQPLALALEKTSQSLIQQYSHPWSCYL